MKTKLLAMLFLAGGSMFAQTRFSIGIGVGGYGQGYYQQAPAYAIVPPYPGPDYSWFDGYWSLNGGRQVWTNGHWFRRPHNTFSGGSYRNDHFDRNFNGGREFRGGDRFNSRNDSSRNRGSERGGRSDNRGSGNRSGRR